jgi:hypothetical protein
MREEGPTQQEDWPAFAGRHEPQPLPFDPAKLQELSERLIRSHWENNDGGVVKALNVIERRLEEAVAPRGAWYGGENFTSTPG